MSSAVRSITSSPSLQPLTRPAWLPERVWPFGTSRLEVDGAGLAITDIGDGPALLFVHTGFWSFIWRDVIARLATGFRCIAFDSPGTGRSDRVPASEITLERASRAVSEVIEAFDPRQLTLVFHDLGGPVAVAGAARSVERISGLVAVNSFAWRPSGAMFRGMLALMGSAPMRELDAMTAALTKITASSFGVGHHLDAESRAAFLAGIGTSGIRTFHRYMHDAHKAESIYERASDALSGPFKGLPLLTIFGERNDPLGFQPCWKRMFPDAQQVVVTKGNHFPMCDDPDLVAESIRSWHRARVARV